MRNFIQNVILVLVLTILLLFSYSYVQDRTKNNTEQFTPAGFLDFLSKSFTSKQAREKEKMSAPDGRGQKQEEEYRAVWLSYLEFTAFRRSVEKNNADSFTTFFQHVLKRSKKCGLNRIIVQVRPFGDALYPSEYFPWAACISGRQGKDPGYDPLKLMVQLAHKEGFTIEAWINPYRISSGSSLEELSEDNPARVWATDERHTRNVLTYEDALYYNPSKQEVQELICHGVKEIVENYDVDGIHMDDYFYPVFTPENVDSAFDAWEYDHAEEKKEKTTLAIWRRNNVNALVSAIYQTIKETDKKKTFGISPAGNLTNLRSDLENYVDVDTWVNQEGYVDYLMPQIYWGFTNNQAPFDEILEQWCSLMNHSIVNLYVGLQLYRMGSEEKGQSDYQELQQPELMTRQLKTLESKQTAKGYCLFSYQYLDSNSKKYHFDSCEFSLRRKKILQRIADNLSAKKSVEKKNKKVK